MQRQYITTRLARAAATLLMLAFVTACEKPILDEKGGEVPTEANVILRFVQNEWTEQREPFELARKWPSRDGQRQSQHEAFSVGNLFHTNYHELLMNATRSNYMNNYM